VEFFCKQYWVQPLSAAVRRNIQTQIALGTALVTETTPSTLLEYKKFVDTVNAASPNFVGAKNPRGYMKLWIIRMVTIFLMRRRGIARLRVGKALVRDALNIFPDEKNNLLPLLSDDAANKSCNSNVASSLKDALAKACYKEPVEFLSTAL